MIIIKVKKYKGKKSYAILFLILLILLFILSIETGDIAKIDKKILKQFVGEAIAQDGTINNAYFGINNEGKYAKNTTNGINDAIEYASKKNIEYIKLEKGIYLIDGISKNTIYNETATKKGIILKSNITLDINGAKLKHIENSAVNYAVISITDVENVKVCNGYIECDRYNHDYDTRKSTHEWGFGIDIRGSKQIEINNIQIEKTTGDGIIVGDYINGRLSQNVKILNCNISDCRRQGISIVCGENIEVEQNEIHDINGTEPQAGIDIEPYPNLQKVNNVRITENILYNFASGRAIAFLGDSQEIVIENNDIRSGGIISSRLQRNSKDKC